MSVVWFMLAANKSISPLPRVESGRGEGEYCTTLKPRALTRCDRAVAVSSPAAATTPLPRPLPANGEGSAVISDSRG